MFRTFWHDLIGHVTKLAACREVTTYLNLPTMRRFKFQNKSSFFCSYRSHPRVLYRGLNNIYFSALIICAVRLPLSPEPRVKGRPMPGERPKDRALAANGYATHYK